MKMDKYERRRLRLLRIKDEECDGNVASLAKRLGKSDSYVHRMLYEEGKAGKKRIGEDSVESIQREFGVNLDGEAPQAVVAQGPEPARQLQWIDEWEARLLSHCRATNDQGRETIMDSAELAPHVLFDEVADQAQKRRG